MNWARNIVEQLMSVPQNLEFFLLSLWDGKLNTARNYNGNTLFDPIWRRTKKIDLFLCFSLSFANQSIAFKVTHRVGTFLRSSWMIQVIFVYFYDFLLAALRTLSAFPFFYWVIRNFFISNFFVPILIWLILWWDAIFIEFQCQFPVFICGMFWKT